MGGSCPSRAVGPTRAASGVPVGGWYRDGTKWVHVRVQVTISDGVDGGIRGTGKLLDTNNFEVYFAHKPRCPRRGEIQQNGDIAWNTWDNSAREWKFASPRAQRFSAPAAEVGNVGPKHADASAASAKSTTFRGS